ncbi:response regulator with CheY-like receiver domain and winged-helix DNA-binding domain [Xenococcus sp. PCC 7305]|uniref:response regulator n=1 Tax=Xenococcus sp. PCC 7305 TaxID=102125 RepID=UPI0002ACEEC5|nr:response regulator [Xenococcus sp. PCC 7305]ELS02744.1 response regulator with CheY-like receiver domain and winged-helix DNA-binding domain [Xenococcus sp. PCC 7305]
MLNLKTHKPIEQIEELSQAKYTGAIKITRSQSEVMGTINVVPKASFLVFDQGRITYADSVKHNPQSLAKKIGKKLKINLIDKALVTVRNKIKNENSFQEIFDLLARFGIVKWEELAKYIQDNIIITIEKIYDKSVTLEQYPDFNFDLDQEHIGLNWQEIKVKIDLRQLKWRELSVKIPHREVIPQLVLKNAQQNYLNVGVQKHCQQWIDGKRSLLDIAEQIDQDPLTLAIQYYDWVQRGWISFVGTELKSSSPLNNSGSDKSNLPIILSVDDSTVVQTMIKRAIGEHYQVILADNGLDALKILTGSPKIKLVLLDVTMPDVDGLEVCQTIRCFKQFKDLPIIMLTAKDRMLDKFKGKFAGSNEYLTKPVDKAKLLETIEKYVPASISI